MYTLTISFGPTGLTWAFLFKDKQRATDTAKPYVQFAGANSVWIEDDYGQTASIPIGSIHGLLIEDMELIQEARVIRSLDEAKTRVRVNKRASTDPELRPMMQSSGPGVITPFASGGFRPQ